MASSDNKRIAKNTLFLYGRMLFLTVISLFTVRITLEAIGVEDYGIYNVVGSFVALFSVLTATLTSATQRFLSFHLGKKDYEGYGKTFSLLLMGFAVISVVILLIGEIAGIYAFDGFLKIPADRLDAAKFVYQTCLVSFLFNMMAIPFTSSIISNERMSAFAYLSILDGVLKLGIVYLLLIFSGEKLKLYGILQMGVCMLNFAFYSIYCHRKFKYCKIRFVWDKGLFKELTAYTGWNLLGALSGVLATQGQNVLLNIYFGPVINAAKAIGDRIQQVISSFSSNFYMAVTPQIIKSYAANELDRMRNLAIQSSKFSFYLLYILSFPLICAMDQILEVWLGPDSKSPEMVGFACLSLVFGLVNCLEQPITQMIRATGKIRNYQILAGSCTLMFIPIAWLTLKSGASPLSTMVVLIMIMALTMVIRLKVAKKQVGLSISSYLGKVVLPIIIVTIPSVLLYWGSIYIVVESLWTGLLIKASGAFVAGVLLVMVFGVTHSERSLITTSIRNRLMRHKNH